MFSTLLLSCRLGRVTSANLPAGLLEVSKVLVAYAEEFDDGGIVDSGLLDRFVPGWLGCRVASDVAPSVEWPKSAGEGTSLTGEMV